MEEQARENNHLICYTLFFVQANDEAPSVKDVGSISHDVQEYISPNRTAEHDTLAKEIDSFKKLIAFLRESNRVCGSI